MPALFDASGAPKIHSNAAVESDLQRSCNAGAILNGIVTERSFFRQGLFFQQFFTCPNMKQRLEFSYLFGIYTARGVLFRRMALNKNIDLSSYVLSDNEEFMNPNQRAYFRAKLIAWRNDILREARETLEHLAAESANHPDLADRASSETDRSIELRARDRQRKLISKIDAALRRIDEGTYGYCEETGEPIGLKRLDARPIATLSIQAQERHERREKVYRDE